MKNMTLPLFGKTGALSVPITRIQLKISPGGQMVSKNDNLNPHDQGKFPLKKESVPTLREGAAGSGGIFPLKKGGVAGGGGGVCSVFPDENFPSPEQLKEYEAVLPGLAQRLISQAENQTAHRIEIENKLVSSGIRKSTLGLIFGFFIGSIGIGGGFYLTALGFNVIGVIFSSATLVSLVSSFIYGSQSRKKEIK
jgi:uncharacterized membrane protein